MYNSSAKFEMEDILASQHMETSILHYFICTGLTTSWDFQSLFIYVLGTCIVGFWQLQQQKSNSNNNGNNSQGNQSTA